MERRETWWTVSKHMEVFLGDMGEKGALERLPATGRRMQDGGGKVRVGGGREGRGETEGV